jgi:4,5-DOPA dioxygenase extradiol
MKRKEFLKSMATLPLLGVGMHGLNNLYNMSLDLETTDLMPVLFLGHGSPMNGIEINGYSNSWKALGESIHRPKMVLCISAHWLTKGTHVTAMESPKTIHDFGGFPDELFAVDYKAPGSKMYAEEVKKAITSTTVGMDHEWGLDHGCWTIIRHMYPDAEIPVLQMSIDYYKDPTYHYELAKQLSSLRRKGVLIVGSGNIVHNLGKISFNGNKQNYGYDWAIQADSEMKKFIHDSNHQPLIEYQKQGSHWQLAIPSPDHYYPLLYTLGLQEKKDNILVFNDKAEMGSITMTSVKYG